LSDLDRLAELEGFWKQENVAKYREVLDQTSRLIQGFETPFLMELLTTVDWIAREQGNLPSVSTVRKGLANGRAGNPPQGESQPCSKNGKSLSQSTMATMKIDRF
jgi:hypothetical protein